MAVTIEDLQVETAPATPSPAQSAGGGGQQQSKPDIKAEIERCRERDLRLKAD